MTYLQRCMGVGVCLVLAAKPASAQNWFALDPPGAAAGGTVEVDMDMFRLVGARREVPIRVTLLAPRVHTSGVSFRSIVAVAELECVLKLPVLRDASFYSGVRGEGNLLMVRAGLLDASAERIGELLPPRTIEMLERAACTRP